LKPKLKTHNSQNNIYIKHLFFFFGFRISFLLFGLLKDTHIDKVTNLKAKVQ